MSERWKPRKYQAESIKKVVRNPGFMLLHDPGLGKTGVILDAFCKLQKKGEVETMLVVGPLNVARSVWTNEVAKFKEFNHLTVSVCVGPKKVREQRAAEWADIYVVNFDNLVSLLEFWEAHPDFRGWKPDMLVVDESTKFKAAYKSVRFRFLKQRLAHFKRRYCLTGTPTPNNMLDIWAQAYIVDLGHALDRRITAFRNRYFDSCGFGGYDWRIKPGAEEEIFNAIAGISERLDKLDNLDVPDLVIQDIDVELPPKLMKEYAKMETFCVAQAIEGNIVAGNAAAATQKLRQMANGVVYGGEDFDDRFVTVMHDAKLKALADTVEQIGRGAIIVYEFTSEVEHIQKALPKDAKVELLGGKHGAKSEQAVQNIIKRWNAKDVDFLILHPDSAGHGLNLQEGGRHIVFFGLSWKLEGYEQTIGRLWRDERKDEHHKIVVHRLVARNTVDEDMIHAVGRKGDAQKRLLDGLKERQANG